MKIGIVGNYGNNNQGDEAILNGILIQLDKNYIIKREDIVVFSNNSEQTREKYGVQAEKLYYKKPSAPMTLIHTVLKNKSVISELDLLIIGGGGILMDLYINSTVIFGMYGWLAKLSGTPVAIYGVGAGPISTRFGKMSIGSLARLSKLVTVRDDASKSLLQSIGITKPIHVIGDPAFQVQAPQRVSSQDEQLQIGVTAVPFYHGSYWPKEDHRKYTNYITGMARNLDRLLEENPNAVVNFLSTKHPQDTAVTEEIKQLMHAKDRCTIHGEGLNHEKIVDLLNKQDIVIGTRLHSLILALVTNTPILAVSYHHKVKDFMQTIGCPEFGMDIETLHTEEDFFLNAYEEMNRNWSGTLSRFESIYNEMKRKSDQGMELLKQIYMGDGK